MGVCVCEWVGVCVCWASFFRCVGFHFELEEKIEKEKVRDWASNYLRR